MAANLRSATDLAAWVSRVDELGSWLRSDMAAVMRQFPEQLSATDWFERTQGRRVDATESIPYWLEHQYGVDVSKHAKSRASSPLTTAAHMISELLASRADALRAAPLYLVDDDVTLRVAVTLAGTPSYANQTGWPATTPAATVLFPKPLPYQHKQDARTATVGVDTPAEMLSRIKPHGPAALEAVTWFTARGVVRCMDWIRPDLDSTGVSEVDEQIVAALAGDSLGKTGSTLPSMIYNGEWHRTVAHSGSDVETARRRIQEATAYVASGHAARWDGGGYIADETGLLVPKLSAVFADCVAAGLLNSVPRKVRGRSGRRMVTLLGQPG